MTVTLSEFKQRVKALAKFKCYIEATYPELREFNQYTRSALEKFLSEPTRRQLLVLAEEALHANYLTCAELARQSGHPHVLNQAGSNYFRRYQKAQALVQDWDELQSSFRRPKVKIVARKEQAGPNTNTLSCMLYPSLVVRHQELLDIEAQLNDAAHRFAPHELEAQLPEILYNL